MIILSFSEFGLGWAFGTGGAAVTVPLGVLAPEEDMITQLVISTKGGMTGPCPVTGNKLLTTDGRVAVFVSKGLSGGIASSLIQV